MSFFSDVLNNLDGTNKKALGKPYSYTKEIKSPKDIGMSGHGSLGTLSKDVGGLIAYTKLLVEGGGEASRVDGPLGNKLFLVTGQNCKDTATGNLVKRSIYINNVPDGSIPFVSSGLDTDFTEFEGLIPGILSDLDHLRPLAIFQAFLSGSPPKCQSVSLEVINSNNDASMGKGYVTIPDIKNLPPCWFPNNTNPVTKKTCTEGFIGSQDSQISDNIAYIYFISLILLVIFIIVSKR